HRHRGQPRPAAAGSRAPRRRPRRQRSAGRRDSTMMSDRPRHDPEPPDRPGGPEPGIKIQRTPDGSTRVDLMDGERSVSRLWVIPLTIRIGAATVRMDGIGGVGTEEDCRHRGYSRRVLEATVDWMRRGDAALSMLYGIPNFYPK